MSNWRFQECLAGCLAFGGSSGGVGLLGLSSIYYCRVVGKIHPGDAAISGRSTVNVLSLFPTLSSVCVLSEVTEDFMFLGEMNDFSSAIVLSCPCKMQI